MTIPTVKQKSYWAIKYENCFLHYSETWNLHNTGPIFFDTEEAAYKWVQTEPCFKDVSTPPEPVRVDVILQEYPSQ